MSVVTEYLLHASYGSSLESVFRIILHAQRTWGNTCSPAKLFIYFLIPSRVIPLWGKFGAKNISYHQILPSRDHFRSLREYMALKKLLWSAAKTFMRRESLAYIISSISWENAKGLHWQFHTGKRRWRRDPMGYHLGIEAPIPTSGQVVNHSSNTTIGFLLYNQIERKIQQITDSYKIYRLKNNILISIRRHEPGARMYSDSRNWFNYIVTNFSLISLKNDNIYQSWF